MRDAMRGYLNAASGLTELTRKRAQDLALSLLSSSGAGSGGAAVAHQVSALAEELVSAARSNRAAVREMIRGEVEIAVAHLGLVPASELASARQQIAALESAVAQLKRGPQSRAAAARSTAAAPAKTRPKRSAVKRAAGTGTTAKKATAKKATAKKATAKKATAKKATAKKATAKKATAKKATAKKATAKKSATKSATP